MSGRRLVAGLVCAGLVGVACSGTKVNGSANGDGGDPGDGSFIDTLGSRSVTKIDLLFMIDNSSSMADKQAVFAAAVPDLVKRLVSPRCVHRLTGLPLGDTPDDPAAPCPDPGAGRELDTVRDVHVGVVTSSLGGHGSSTCEPRPNATPLRTEMEDDRAELVGSRPRFAGLRSAGGQNPTSEGFLNWNPVVMPGQPVGPFNVAFQDMTRAAGEFGCGFESQLESIYRFLVDPAPPVEIVIGPCGGGSPAACAVSAGVNQTVLAQRAAFLRPDSLVAVVMLTDENDCSVKDNGQNYFVARQDIPPLGASSACATDPNNACCYSCLAAPPAGCAADAGCTSIDEFADPPSLRCFDQKRRFGLDFLYPTKRYVNALKNSEICPEVEDLDCATGGTPVDNPLFVNPRGAPRDPSLVFLAGIVGVPWQDLKATTILDAEGNPQPVPPAELHYVKTSDPMMAEVWPVILGMDGAPPRDALMRENIFPRGGDGPIEPGIGTTGQIMPPTSAPLANPANGHEYASSRGDDLQYACIFRLEQPRNCADFDPAPPTPGSPPGGVDRPFCDCDNVAVSDQNPLCQADDGSYSRMQRYAKAYPSLRELQVLKDFGSNSVVASICARNLTDPNAQDYGYRPAVDAIMGRLTEALNEHGCLPRRVEVDENGNVPCKVLEVTSSGECAPAQGRVDASAGLEAKVFAHLERQDVCGGAGQPPCDTLSVCELQRADDNCLADVAYSGSPGWCYVDPLPPAQGGQGVGDISLVAECRDRNEMRIIRFVDPDKRTPAPGAQVLLVCDGPA